MKKQIAKKIFSAAKSPFGDLIVGLAFEKYSKLLPVKVIDENERIISFWHPKPSWEKHILIVPKKSIKKLTLLKNEDYLYVREVYKMANKLVKKFNLESKGYTILSNGGKKQEVNQLHFHLISGKKLNI